MEPREFEGRHDQEISNESATDHNIQAIKDAWDKGENEMNGIPLGLCAWKDRYLWHQGKI